MSKKNKKTTPKSAKNAASSTPRAKPNQLFRIGAGIGILAVLLVLIPFGKNNGKDTHATGDHPWKVIRKLPHDPNAFTQGLVYQNGKFFESTGQYGQSSLRRVQPENGFIEQQHNLDAQYFGEGLTFYKGVLIQITWKSQQAFFYDSSNFEILRQYRYENQGWGITSDGQKLFMSDGSDKLTVRNPDTFEVERAIQVTGHEINRCQLNELEYINGEIWANVWRTEYVLRIDPQTGETLGRINFAGLLADEDRNGREDVLNGIAYNPDNDEIYITGKYYSHIYQVSVDLPDAPRRQ